MNDLARFEPATPAMIVGRRHDGGNVPLGLDEPFALLGGDRLGADGIPYRLLHDHQPAFKRWVAESCETLLEAGRPWFKAPPILLTGPTGAGRSHAARWLASVAGVPHIFLNLLDPVMASNLGASRTVSEALWASPMTIGMAAARCANPVVSVLAVDQLSDDAVSGLVSMLDPETGSRWFEDQLQTEVDFGEVSWILQCRNPNGVSAKVRNLASSVELVDSPLGIDTPLSLSILLEAMRDLGVMPTHPGISWDAIRRRFNHSHRPSANTLYAGAANVVTGLLREWREAHAS